MTLDSTARRANILDSIKSWAVADIEKPGRPVTFEKWLTTPSIADGAAKKWVAFVLGPIDPGTLAEIMLDIYCCTRNDPEGFIVSQVADNVMEQLSDTTITDGMKRIPFYKSAKLKADWVLLGALVVQDVKMSGSLEADDGTKFIILSCRLRTAMKI